MSMAMRHVPGLSHPVLPSDLQPMVRSCFSSGRSSPSASIQACCCINRCLCHGLGSHVQRACSCGALDRAPTAVECQLPRVASSMACSAPLQNAATRQACTGPYGQHCDRCVHQPPGRSTHHNAIDGKSVGKHDLVVTFLRGARRLNPPCPHLVPSWDLPSVLTALKEEPFEPLQSVELKFLSLKTVLLTALASVKRVGDLQAFSVDNLCRLTLTLS